MPEHKPLPAPEPNVDEGLEFELLQESTETAGNSVVTIETTGRTTCTVTSSQHFDAMCGARQGDDLYMLKIGVNKALKTIALYKATPADAVKIPIRRSGPQRKTISFHLKEVWVKYPELKPERRMECLATPSVDKKGRPCVILPIGAGWDKRKKKGGKENGGSTQNQNASQVQNQPQGSSAPASPTPPEQKKEEPAS